MPNLLVNYCTPRNVIKMQQKLNAKAKNSQHLINFYRALEKGRCWTEYELINITKIWKFVNNFI